MKVVWVKWDDHYTSQSGWASIEDTIKEDKPAYIETVGWLLSETDKYIMVGTNIDTSNNNVNQYAVILKATIKEVIYVEDIRSIGSARESGPVEEGNRRNRRLKS